MGIIVQGLFKILTIMSVVWVKMSKRGDALGAFNHRNICCWVIFAVQM